MRPIIPGTELIPIASLPALYNPRDLALIRRTVATDTTDDEFALFIHWARSPRLDPLRRQVHAFVFHKTDPKKRRLSLVTSIEGFRAIAARTGNYRPDENEPAFIADDAQSRDQSGLVSCSVRVWQFAHGQWFPITGVARWEEFAPLKTVWVDNQPTDRKVLDKSGRWGDMPFFMLAKCAEAQAIRKGWPEDLSNTFVGEEIEQAALTLHPAQAAAEGATRERLERIAAATARLSSPGSTPRPSAGKSPAISALPQHRSRAVEWIAIASSRTVVPQESVERAEMLRTAQKMAEDIRVLKANVEAMHATQSSAIAELAGKVEHMQRDSAAQLSHFIEWFDRMEHQIAAVAAAPHGADSVLKAAVARKQARGGRGDAFDPSQNPTAPGAPRPLGSHAPAATKAAGENASGQRNN